MINRDVLQIEKRRIIYNCIKRNPGLHFREISRKLDIPKTTLDYHLLVLKKEGFISAEIENGYQRYYDSKKISNHDKKILNVMRETVPRNLILFLMLQPNSSQDKILKFAKKWKNHPSKIGLNLMRHRTTISFHLRKLVDLGVIDFCYVNGEKCYFLKNPGDIFALCTMFEKSLLAEAHGRVLKHIDFDMDETIDRIAETVFMVFPNPYCC